MCAVADPQGGLQPPYGLQPPLEQGELEEEKVKGEEEEEEEGFSPPYGCNLDPPLDVRSLFETRYSLVLKWC